MSGKDYHIGLDIGTSSVGYAVMDSNYRLMRAKGKTLIGASLFREGKTAADRRGFRTTRRRLRRRKRRIQLLEEFFDKHLLEIDDTFLARLHEADVSPKDTSKKFLGSLLFPDRGDGDFYTEYPTIYHLRKALIEEDRKFDIREVYLAIHHIIKYRGNFLSPLTVESFKNKNLKLSDQLRVQLEGLVDIYHELDAQVGISTIDIDKIQEIIIDKKKSRRDKASELKKLFAVTATDKGINKFNANLAKELSNAILGMKAQFSVLLLADDVIEDKNSSKFSLLDTDIDEKTDALLAEVSDRQVDAFNAIKTIHDQIVLNEIVPDGKSISQAMVDKYNAHKEQLRVLKSLYSVMTPKQVQTVKKAYALYIGGKTVAAKQYDKRNKAKRLDFYKEIKRVLSKIDDPRAKSLLDIIENEQFLPKQRTAANGVIPNQLHQVELDKIIENQVKYYPWLGEKNPVQKHKKYAPYKLDELLTFRVPYYVGPMITEAEQKKASDANFAWMIRKEDGDITPWNFDDKVDRIASANKFIKRMTAKDTYLIGEDVLPDNSLLYQRFKVLNELNNVSVNGRKLSVDLKREAYVDLFENGNAKTVSIDHFKNWLNLKLKNLGELKLKGLSNKDKFNNSLSTYHDMVKIFGETVVKDISKQADLEKIIELITILKMEKSMLKKKLGEISWLTDGDIKKLTSLTYSGWGRLSKKLLAEICDSNGQRIIDHLWDTQSNFMQIQTQPDFQRAIIEHNSDKLDDGDIEQILSEAYTSPQNKKAIRRVIKVVKDIEKAMHGAPASISIEFTRSNERSQLTKSRLSQVQKTLTEVSKEIVGKALLAEFKDFQDSKKKLTDKYYLYFTQLGRDIYTGEPLNIDQLSSYNDGDHILPRSFIKDNSLDNRVLTNRAVNNEKSATVPIKEYGKMKPFWEKLYDNGLISRKKYENLLTDYKNIEPYKANGFIRRQLVETSQVIKLSAEILQSLYAGTEIIEVRQKYPHEIRESLGFPKIRQLNDYHHAFDAYLTTFCGRYLYQRYPKLHGYFVYGDYNRYDAKTDKNYLKNFNFLYDLTDGKKEEISDNVDHQVFLNRDDAINQLKKVYNYKFMLISQEVYTNSGAMFDQTIYSAKAKKTLIKKKLGKDVGIYGGYSGNKDTYLSIIRLEDKKKVSFKVVGIPMRYKAELDRLEKADNDKYLHRLNEIVAERISAKEKKNGFRLILPKVHLKQLVIDDIGKFMLGSSTYLYNARQLVLSPKSVKILANGDAKDSELITVYNEIVTEVNNNFAIFDINKQREKLTQAVEVFKKLDTKEKKECLLNILDGLHANSTMLKLKIFKGVTPFGMLQRSSGIILSEDARIIYQSPTGIFRKSINLKDL